MHIDSIEIKNFLSIEDVTVELKNRGIMLITGRNYDDEAYSSNGSGKTTILEALFWCLFNTSLRGMRGNDVVRRGTKHCEVVVKGHDDHTPFTVTRSRVQGSPALVIDYGDDRYEKDLAQHKIEEMVGDKEVFRTIVAVDTSFLDLPEPARRAWIEKSLGVGWIDDSHEIAKEALTKAQKAFDTNEAKKSALSDELSKTRLDLESFDTRNDRTDITTELHRLESEDLVKHREHYTKLKVEIEKHECTHTEAKASLHDIQVQLDDAQAERTMIVQEHTTKVAEVESKVRAKLNEISLHEKEIEKIERLEGQVQCPTCGQKITKEHIESSIAVVQKRIDGINVPEHLVTEAKQVRDEALSQVNMSIAKLQEKRSVQQESVDGVEVQLASVRKELDEVRAKVGSVESRVQVLSEKLTMLDKQKQDLEKAVTRLDVQIKNYQEQSDKLSFAVERFTYWTKVFSKDIRIFLIQTAIKKLNKFLREISPTLLGDSITVQFSAVDKKKTVTRSAFTVELNKPYTSLSTGEKRRVDLVILFALFLYARQRQSLNCIFLDEVFDGLDGVGADSVVTTLKKVEALGNVGTIFVITHNDMLADQFGNAMVVEKRDGVSKIV